MSVTVYVTEPNERMVSIMFFISEDKNIIKKIENSFGGDFVRTLKNSEIWLKEAIKLNPKLKDLLTEDVFFTLRSARITLNAGIGHAVIPHEVLQDAQKFLCKESLSEDTIKSLLEVEFKEFQYLLALNTLTDFVNGN